MQQCVAWLSAVSLIMTGTAWVIVAPIGAWCQVAAWRKYGAQCRVPAGTLCLVRGWVHCTRCVFVWRLHVCVYM